MTQEEAIKAILHAVDSYGCGFECQREFWEALESARHAIGQLENCQCGICQRKRAGLEEE